jgi:hypothetical protein
MVEGSGFRVWGLGLRVQGAGCRVRLKVGAELRQRLQGPHVPPARRPQHGRVVEGRGVVQQVGVGARGHARPQQRCLPLYSRKFLFNYYAKMSMVRIFR